MERAPGDDGPPIAGLTVLAFANNHLVYALTWAALALMAAGAVAMVDREAWRAGGGGLTRRSRRGQDAQAEREREGDGQGLDDEGGGGACLAGHE